MASSNENQDPVKNDKEDNKDSSSAERAEAAGAAWKEAAGAAGKEAAGATASSCSEDEGAQGPLASGIAKGKDTIDAIRYYLAEKLGFYDDTGSDDETDSRIKILDDTTLSGVVKYIQEKNITKIVTMAGAGISTSAGIPDFRSPVSGLYHNLAKYNLPDPQAVFEIGFFRSNPKPFFTLAKELYPGAFKPTASHYFIRILHEKGLLLRHYTQNIDTLERVAGIPGEKIVEAHGTFHTSHCLDCCKEYDLVWMKGKIFKDDIPTCEECNGYVKPDIVFFGENLPTKFFECVEVDFPDCELLLVLGSSLVVQPFASLIDKVPDTCPRLLVNRERAGERNPIMRALGLSHGMDFDSSKNSRDVAWLGDCDDGCKALARMLGWEDDLMKLVEEEHKKIDEATKAESSANM